MGFAPIVGRNGDPQTASSDAPDGPNLQAKRSSCQTGLACHALFGSDSRMEIETLIIGAGAAGMMCAAHAGSGVMIVDHAKAAGEKIRISGGGRCNFTNLHCAPDAFLSENPHFAKSALARYTQWDFIELIDQHGIQWHEKTLGQLFCDTSAKEIIEMLRNMMQIAGAQLALNTSVDSIAAKSDGGFKVLLSGARNDTIDARNVVIATGGKSIPKMGATGFAYEIAHQFGLHVTARRPALVPFTFTDKRFAPISGVSTPARVTAGAGSFDEAVLFTHRGLSGPAILQVSSYWHEGEAVRINLIPDQDLTEWFKTQRQSQGKKQITTVLSDLLPSRLVDHIAKDMDIEGRVGDLSDKRIQSIVADLTDWHLTPQGTEGYRTAEVTIGGVSTADLNAQTMEAKAVPGLYFIGECVDVTGWLGGYNFQWAWASGMAAARAITV